MARKVARVSVRDVEVTLICGCRILLCERPNSPGSKLACPNKLGHGYNLEWVKWRDVNTEASGDNPMSTKEI
jgi:hypothetical protein